jgi:DNA-nicking Smr family endonuclease
MSTERKGKGRSLSAEEEALWQSVAVSITPLPKRRRRKSPLTAVVPASLGAAAIVGAPDAARPAGAARTPPQLPPPPAAKPKPKAPPPMADFESRAARRLAAGKLDIDGRLDLHGMRQDEAHGALRRFLAVAQMRGARYVKVITGKGRPVDDTTPFSMGDDRRGVLRDQVPRWLASPDLRDLVVGFTEAGRPHGGSGALYVRLRRRRG